jgi:hypothetical protein
LVASAIIYRIVLAVAQRRSAATCAFTGAHMMVYAAAG